MKSAGMFIVGLLVVGALAFWIRMTVGHLPSVHVPTVASLVGTTTGPTLTANVATAAKSGDYVDLTGTMLLDTSSGVNVPFIQYIDANNKVATKQLVYADSRACAAYAGDLPCVDVNENSAYPQYPTGTKIRVRGLHTEDRILVYQVDTI